jgi:hypothetical protein
MALPASDMGLMMTIRQILASKAFCFPGTPIQEIESFVCRLDGLRQSAVETG